MNTCKAEALLITELCFWYEDNVGFWGWGTDFVVTRSWRRVFLYVGTSTLFVLNRQYFKETDRHGLKDLKWAERWSASHTYVPHHFVPPEDQPSAPTLAPCSMRI